MSTVVVVQLDARVHTQNGTVRGVDFSDVDYIPINLA